MYKVSVIISTYTILRDKYVLKCISSLINQTKKPDEIILVLDPNPDLIKHYELIIPKETKIVISDGFSLSEARNCGIKHSNGDILYFIDDDAFADKNCIKKMLKNYSNSKVVCVGGHIEPLWENKRPCWLPEELFWIINCSYKGLPQNRSVIRNPLGANMSFRKSVFKKVGYFNTSYGRIGKKLLGNEETELSLRIINELKSSKIIYEPCAIVFHRVPKERLNIKYLIKRSYYEGFVKSFLIKKNLSITQSFEHKYLKDLLTVVIPSKISNLINFNNFIQIIIIFLIIFFTGIGYLSGILKVYAARVNIRY